MKKPKVEILVELSLLGIASVFRHPASQSGTVAFRYRLGYTYSGNGQSGIPAFDKVAQRYDY
jgi:hypothetical protein